MTRYKLAYRRNKRFQARLERYANGYTFMPYNNLKKKWTPTELKRLERAIRLYGREHIKAIARCTRSESSCMSRLKSLISKKLITRQFNNKDDRVILALYDKFQNKDDKVIWKCLEKYMYGRSAKQIKERYKNHLAVSTADWTDEEIKYILKTKPKTTFSKIARHLGRSPHDIKRIYKRITQYIPPEGYDEDSSVSMSMLANPNYYQAYYERQRYPKHTDGSYYTVEELDPSLKKFSKQYKYSSSCYSVSKDTAALNVNPSPVEKDLSTSSASSTSGKSEKVPIKSEFPALNKEEDEDLEEDEETEAPKQKKQEEPKSTPHGRAYPKTYYRPRQAGVHSDPILSYHILPKDSFARAQPPLSQVQSTSPKTTLNPEQSPSSMRSLSNSYTPHFLPTPISSKPLYPSFMVPSAPLPLFEGVYAYDPASLNPSVQQDRRFLPPSYAVPVTLPTQQAFVSDSVLSDPLSKKFGANEKGAPAAYSAYIYPQMNSMAPYFAYYPQQFSKTSNPSCPPLYPTSPSPELLSFYSTPLAKGRTPVSNLSPSPYNVVDVTQKKSSSSYPVKEKASNPLVYPDLHSPSKQEGIQIHVISKGKLIQPQPPSGKAKNSDSESSKRNGDDPAPVLSVKRENDKDSTSTLHFSD